MSSIRLIDRPRDARRIHVRRAPAGAVLLLGMLALAAPARAQVVDPSLWMTWGDVNAVALSGNTLYIGGSFGYVGPNTGGFVGIDATTGSVRPVWPRVEGAVYASVSDGAGGWYIGGSFQKVAGVPRANLAHIRANGSLDGWNPGANSNVNALALSGSTVYAGGYFTNIGGQPRNIVAALDAVSGLATAFNAGAADNYVNTLAVSGSSLWVGGSFSSMGGKSRFCLAALDATTGLATAVNTAANNEVMAVAVLGSTVYVGGYFTSIGGLARHRIAALDAATGHVTAWNPAADDAVLAMAVSGSTVWVGGSFFNIGGQSRVHIAGLDAATGLATAFDPGYVVYDVSAIGVAGSTVYVGGDFVSIHDQPHQYFAAIDAATGLPKASPLVDGPAHTFGVSGSTVYVGGLFNSIGGLTRRGVAALDVTTGQPTAWDPGGECTVNAFAFSGSTVYTGGYIHSIGGQPRGGIAALDAATGLATPWNPGWTPPDLNNSVNALVLSGSTVYVGGNFTNIGGQPRNYIAALDAATGLATAWNPAADRYVSALAVSGSTVYASGFFTSIGGQPRSYMGALDATTGLATAWNPGANGFANAFAVSGSTIYAAGNFNSIGGQARGYGAALDAATALPAAWDPNANNELQGLALNGSTIYVAGPFSSIGGQPRQGIAELDAATGLATAWNAGINSGNAIALALSGSTIYAGGRFGEICGHAVANLAKILPAPVSPPSATVLSPNGGETATIGSTRTLSWTATTSAPGVQSVDLHLSRSGPAGPWELLAAGAPNTGAYDWPVTAPASSGTCFLRVDARDYAGGIGSDVSDAGFTIADGSLAVEPPTGATFALGPMAPNPVRGLSQFSYVVPHGARVRITLLDVQGRELAVLADGQREAGRYTVPLDGSALRPGLHFVRMQAAGTELRQRVIVVQSR